MAHIYRFSEVETEYLLALVAADREKNGSSDISRGVATTLKRQKPGFMAKPVESNEVDNNQDLECPEDLLQRIRPLSGSRLPVEWSDTVKLCVRPYYRITASVYNAARAITELDSDIFLLDGKTPVIFSQSGDHFHMIPLRDNYHVDL